MTARIGVLGATGNVGGAALRALQESGVEPVALLRDPARLKGDTQARHADLAHLGSLAEAFLGLDRLLLCSGNGPGLAELQLNAVRAAEEAQLERVVKVSGSPMTMFEGTPVAVARDHLKVERALGESAIDGVSVRPNVFMENFLEQATAIANGALPGPEGDPRISFVAAADVGATAAALLLSDHTEPLVEVTGAEAHSLSDVAATMSELLGRGVTYFPAPPDVVRQAMAAQGQPTWRAEHVIEIGKLAADPAAANVTDAVARIAGRAPQSLRDFIRGHAAVFSAAVA